MPTDHLSSDVVRIHREMLAILAQLDRSGEHVAAAHLAAAIDSLEDRLDPPSSEISRNSATNPIEAMSLGLIERLGRRADITARQQLAAATGQQVLVWAAIASRVDQLLVRQSAASTT